MSGCRVEGGRGFTLLELIITMGIIGIVAAVAVPSILSFLPGYRLDIATQDLVSDLQQARSEAIKRNATCTLTFGDNSYEAKVGAATVLAETADDHPGISYVLEFVGTSFSYNSRGLCDIEGDVPLPNGIKVGIIVVTNGSKSREVMISLAGGVKVTD